MSILTKKELRLKSISILSINQFNHIQLSKLKRIKKRERHRDFYSTSPYHPRFGLHLIFMVKNASTKDFH